MADDGESSGGDEEPQLTEEEIVKQVTEKVFDAFKQFDPEGNGGQVKSDCIRDLLEYIEIKISEQEMYKIVADIDPEQTGYIEVSAFK